MDTITLTEEFLSTLREQVAFSFRVETGKVIKRFISESIIARRLPTGTAAIGEAKVETEDDQTASFLWFLGAEEKEVNIFTGVDFFNPAETLRIFVQR